MTDSQKLELAERVIRFKRKVGIPYCYWARQIHVANTTMVIFANGTVSVIGVEKCQKLKELLSKYSEFEKKEKGK